MPKTVGTNSDSDLKTCTTPFFRSSRNATPDLTTNDKHLCALLRLGLSTKEIASITFKEVRSIESGRNRLRKKLGLPEKEDLVKFLSEF